MNKIHNALYYGDNLKILREYISDESVDLVYLDPPFKSGQNYNVLFEEKDGSHSAAQIQAFEDTWSWDQAAAAAYEEIVEKGPERVSQMIQAFRLAIGENDMLAYLSMMAPRLIELHRALKSTGSIYLHCDPAASHYLKLIMDAVFEPGNFHSEIIWKRSASHGGAASFHAIHDTLLFYSKSSETTWTNPRVPYNPEYINSHYRLKDPSGQRYQLISAHGAGTGPSRKFGDRLINPPTGRHWMSQEHIDMMMAVSKVVFTKSGMPRYMRYLDETKGAPLGDIWIDIPPINSQAAERLGYPTQKPEALLERIIQTSSTEGDLILDPFCGCGTAVAVAQRLNRQWIGIDITHLAISLMKHRLVSTFGKEIEFEVIGEPVALSGAEALAKEDPYQFQWWALGLVGARPAERKKGADKGIDGRLYFHDNPKEQKAKQIIFSVKSGKVQVSHLRDLRGVLDREKAEIGVLITLNKPTKPMIVEAASAGFYTALFDEKFPRIQILTIEDLLEGKKVEYPSKLDRNVTLKKAPKAKKKKSEQKKLSLDE